MDTIVGFLVGGLILVFCIGVGLAVKHLVTILLRDED